jgi:hypothetical protein
MTLLAQLASDQVAIFLSDWAIAAVLRARGATSGSAGVSIVISDPEPQMLAADGGVEDRREAQIVAQSSALAAILSRPLERGDQVIVASGAYAGTWIISRCQTDLVGLTTAQAVLSDLHAPGAPRAREVR